MHHYYVSYSYQWETLHGPRDILSHTAVLMDSPITSLTDLSALKAKTREAGFPRLNPATELIILAWCPFASPDAGAKPAGEQTKPRSTIQLEKGGSATDATAFINTPWKVKVNQLGMPIHAKPFYDSDYLWFEHLTIPEADFLHAAVSAYQSLKEGSRFLEAKPSDTKMTPMVYDVITSSKIDFLVAEVNRRTSEEGWRTLGGIVMCDGLWSQAVGQPKI